MPVADWARHLLKYKDGRFLRCKFFTFYAFNLIQRHNNNTQGNYFFNSDHFHGKEPPTVEDVQDDLRKGDTTYISKLQYFTQGIKGSDAFWRSKTKEIENWILHHVSEGRGPPTFFITLSCAENWWPDLKRIMIQLEELAGNKAHVKLLKTENSQDAFDAMAKSVKRYPLYVNDYFMRRAKDFMESVVKKALGIEHYWGRVEFAPGRGQIHLHLLAIAEDKAYLNEYYQAVTSADKAQVIADYAEQMLDMTADVDAIDDRDYHESKVRSPLFERYSECQDPKKDADALAQACMMHHCNCGCLRARKKGMARECKNFAGTETHPDTGDTPGWDLHPDHVLHVDNRGIRHLQMRRTKSRRVFQHSRTFLKTWRANCDVKLLLYNSDPSMPNMTEIDNIVRYIVAYTSKKSKTHSEEKNIIQDIITR